MLREDLVVVLRWDPHANARISTSPFLAQELNPLFVLQLVASLQLEDIAHVSLHLLERQSRG
eukprot:6538776-Heterocapsa_arctica.AAC.1